MTNFSKEPDVLNERMCIALYTGPKNCNVKPERNDRLKPTVEVSVAHYQDVENRKTQIDSPIKVERGDAKRMAHDRRHYIKIDPEHDEYHDKFFGRMTELESLWDSHLGRTSVAKHRIELTSDEI